MDATQDEVLRRLRDADPVLRAGIEDGPSVLTDGIRASGVRFAALGGGLEDAWHRALAELSDCIRPVESDRPPILLEGGFYQGSWMESTASISAEVLARFVPSVTRETHLAFASAQREDGLLPYKITTAGPGFAQIQMVTPFARTVWNTYLLDGRNHEYLRTMYDAMARHDDWLALHHDTRGTGCVEAFCNFDTGHDLSPRFWHVPDTCPDGDATRFDEDSLILPFLAPDLTANVACQRFYLGRIAAELGEDPEPWQRKAEASLEALFAHCFDAEDGFFYDRDAQGRLVRVQSDVLLRVLACEVGDADFFASSLERYLLNTRKFYPRYPFPSLAIDDPRFDHDHTHNSWGGPTNFLTLIRAPHAFELHGHVTELAAATMPVLAAVARMTTFPQALNPWSGEPGFTEKYSPAILWLLDAVERMCGVLPRPDGEVWFTGLTPANPDFGQTVTAVASARTVQGVEYELVCTRHEATVYRDGVEHLRFPRGLRVIADADGAVRSVVGMVPGPVTGELVINGEAQPVSVQGNQTIDLLTGTPGRSPSVVAPSW
jgi:hypothetical protein